LYPRLAYVSTLALAIAALQLSVAFGSGWQSGLAYGITVGLAAVVFYQGERRVTTGGSFVNAGIAIVGGTAASLLFATGLVAGLLGAPWDLALWQIGILMWGSWFGIAVAFVSAFFVVGFAASIH